MWTSSSASWWSWASIPARRATPSRCWRTSATFWTRRTTTCTSSTSPPATACRTASGSSPTTSMCRASSDRPPHTGTAGTSSGGSWGTVTPSRCVTRAASGRPSTMSMRRSPWSPARGPSSNRSLGVVWMRFVRSVRAMRSSSRGTAPYSRNGLSTPSHTEAAPSSASIFPGVAMRPSTVSARGWGETSCLRFCRRSTAIWRMQSSASSRTPQSSPTTDSSKVWRSRWIASRRRRSSHSDPHQTPPKCARSWP
mmetsp:Transcript_23495/g.67505  ORF Transcript_23495/g.67505 Transcript_23495/m.67505 type:complete len:253 (-) Transcript_23495:3756-4514(-)